jgi:hypothetical protein
MPAKLKGRHLGRWNIGTSCASAQWCSDFPNDDFPRKQHTPAHATRNAFSVARQAAAD